MKLMPAIIGDICGSIYEWNKIKIEPENLMLERCHFTDDTVHTIAIAEAIIENPEDPDFETKLVKYTGLYPTAGYGNRFLSWCFQGGPNDSFGNGCCMRISPIMEYYDNKGATLAAMVAKSVSCSHDTIQAYEHAFLYVGMKNLDLESDFDIVEEVFSPAQLDFASGKVTLENYKVDYKFDATCQGSVPEAIIIAKTSNSYADCIRRAISLGGDSDTIACMAGALFGEESSKEYLELEKWAWHKLPERFQNVITKFNMICKN